jgi:hypothetical protein
LEVSSGNAIRLHEIRRLIWPFCSNGNALLNSTGSVNALGKFYMTK